VRAAATSLLRASAPRGTCPRRRDRSRCRLGIEAANVPHTQRESARGHRAPIGPGSKKSVRVQRRSPWRRVPLHDAVC